MKKLGILVSGQGSNMTAILNACEQGYLQAEVEVVISSNPDAKALTKAKERKIDAISFNETTNKNPEVLDTSICEVLYEHKVDLVLLAGFMKKIGPKVLSIFEGSILNIHPSLLPKFKGLNTFFEVLKNKEKKTGCTVHYVDEKLDNGKIISQRSFYIDTNDNEEILKKKTQKLEYSVFPESIIKIFRNN